MHTYSITEEGKLKVLEHTVTETSQEYTYEELEQQIAHCESSMANLQEHLNFYTGLLEQAKKLNISKQISNNP